MTVLAAGVGGAEAGVLGVALTFAAAIIAGSWKALRDQQSDHAAERKEWLLAMREQTQAVANLSQAAKELFDMVRMSIVRGDR